MPPKAKPKTAPFVQNMWEVLHDPEVKHIIDWEGEDAFVVHKIDDFSTQVLPRLCNSQSFCSFVRQLNGYSWSKADNKRAIFKHDLFRKDSPENLPLISRRRAAKRRGAGEEHGHKHVAGGTDGEGGPTVREVPVESAAQAPEGARQRRAGHEGERRDMAQSALLALKQVMSAALAARAFASPGKAPASPDLLTSTLQHTVSGLVAAHRPDLLPPRSSSVPPLPVLDIALSRMLMDLSGGEDIAHTSQVPTHGPAAVAPFAAHAPPPLAAASTPPADFSASSSRVEARPGHQHPSPASSPPSPPDSGSSTATPQSGPAFASSHQSTGDGAGPTVPSPKHLMVPDHAAREELLMDYGGALGQPAFPDHDSLAGDGVEVPF